MLAVMKVVRDGKMCIAKLMCYSERGATYNIEGSFKRKGRARHKARAYNQNQEEDDSSSVKERLDCTFSAHKCSYYFKVLI